MSRLQKMMELAARSNFEYLCLLDPESGCYERCGSDEKDVWPIPQEENFDAVVRDIRDNRVVLQERKCYYEKAVMKKVLEQMNHSGYHSYRYALADGTREAAFYWFEPTHTEILMIVTVV